MCNGEFKTVQNSWMKAQMYHGEFKTVQNDLLVWKVENNMGWK